MAEICAFERFSFSGLLLFSSCMYFSHREIKSRSDSFALGFGTGIKITDALISAMNLMFMKWIAQRNLHKLAFSDFSSLRLLAWNNIDVESID